MRCSAAGGGGRTLRRSPQHGSDETSHGGWPLEATAEGRGIVVRIPTEGGGRLVIEMSPQEAGELAAVLTAAI